jgi:anti-sigma regulatory factor (Ser/Thr protein kinase)
MAAQETRFEIVGLREQIPLASNFVAEVARHAGLDERGIHHCQLAVDEACTNIVEHGYGSNGADRIIQIVCKVDNPYLTIMLLDNSAAFNPLTRPDPDPATPLDQRGGGGWGIYFIKKLMDHVSYARDGHVNRLTMVKRLGQPTPPVLPDE